MLLENNPLFNAGHGAVFTSIETHELEASVMVSKGSRKRGVGAMRVTKAKNPILLAKEMLLRGEEDDGGGAGPHVQIAGETCDKLASQWGLDLVEPDYFWTRKRWDEHRRGLDLSHDDETYQNHRRAAQENSEDTGLPKSGFDNPGWDGQEYLPQGTVGCVVLDSSGTICVATSTGGITNKLPGRIGDTPTLGAGFWAEQWYQHVTSISADHQSGFLSSMADCFPSMRGYVPLPHVQPPVPRAVGMSGTGNGDSFLRLSAIRTAAAMARFSCDSTQRCGTMPLQTAVSAVAGPHGALQQSAEDRWHKTGEGEGGIIGIDFEDGKGHIVADFNCGGMFRVWIDDHGRHRMAVFREELP
ncbi:hypothetical protein LTR78_006163 [Recurvomyces mirabilis]|uniref:L-asparaginase n=1 Tax=Recurvomyces mirabilis TaxID=574656 RepID=A0AAE0WLM1_9PEZI|nr:hypothetical protein LTR78_006163 [Recurvomyces mirabilis]KAK5152005.1 hypothetical protein LTS14_008779 [Recurvomyces mirabilis]